MQGLARLCTGPRVTLLAVLAASYTLFLALHAEMPLQTALQVAVELQKAKAKQQTSDKCGAALRSAGTRVDDPLLAFDGRKLGYGKTEALTILCAMTANGGAGKALYLDRHFRYDMVFPFLYGPAIAGLYLFLLGSFGRQTRWLKYFALVPIAAAALDLAENLVVRRLVVAGPPPDAALVSLASILTVSKYALVGLSAIVTLGLLLWCLVSQSFSRAQ